MSGAAIDIWQTSLHKEEAQISTSKSMMGSEASGRTPAERHTILHRISRQLVELDREKDSTPSINVKRFELRRLWNTALPIHTLHDELLAQIFASFQADPRASSPEPAPRREGARPITVWHGLMLVCSHWRNLLVSTPAFWRTVSTKRHVEWTRLCLYRSAAAPLDVRARVWDRHALNMLYPEVHRFQQLSFSAGSPGPLVQAALPPLLGGGMPLLEHLDVSLSPMGQRGAIVDFGIYLTSSHFPRLQTLALEWVISPGDKPLYAQLRTLSLYRCTHSVSFDGFLDALAGCAQLEELTLTGTLYSLAGEWMTQVSTIPHRQPITLPSLREFGLDENWSSIIPRFLAHLHIPATASLRVTCDILRAHNGGGGLDPERILSTLLPPNRFETLPILSTTSRVATMFMPGQWCTWAHAYTQPSSGTRLPLGWRQLEDEEDEEVEMEEMEDEEGMGFPREESSHAVFTLYSDRGVDEDPWTGRGLGDLAACFTRSPLTFLELDDLSICTSVAGWESVFRTFSLLEELVVSHRVEPSQVFLGLHAASSSGAVACLKLAHVSARGWGMVATYEAMHKCFQHRADRGARLKHLDLCQLFDGEDLTSEARSGFVAALRQAVGAVEDN